MYQKLLLKTLKISVLLCSLHRYIDKLKNLNPLSINELATSNTRLF